MNNTLQMRSRREGFTLLEVAIATVIIAVGLTALMSTLRAGTSVNSAGSRMTTALFLAQNIHEYTRQMSLNMVADLSGKTFPGIHSGKIFHKPIDGTGKEIDGHDGWKQIITASWRNHENLMADDPIGLCNVVGVTVIVTYHDVPVYTSQYFIYPPLEPATPPKEDPPKEELPKEDPPKPKIVYV